MQCVFLVFDSEKLWEKEKSSGELRALLSDLLNLKTYKDIFSLMSLIHYGIPLCLNFTSILTLFLLLPCCGGWLGKPQCRWKIYSRVQISVPLPPTPLWKLRSATRLTHHTLKKKRWSQRLYWGPHGSCLQGNYPSYASSSMLWTRYLSSSFLLCPAL